MSISGFSSLPSLFVAANSSPHSAAAQNTQRVPQNTNNSAPIPKPTEVQQVYQLYNQGQSVPRIAISLSLPVEAVNNFLDITESESFGASLFAPANSSSSLAAAQAIQQVPQSTNSSSDTVTLTEAQRVYQLYNQGYTVSQIASSLSVTAAQVGGYLENNNAG